MLVDGIVVAADNQIGCERSKSSSVNCCERCLVQRSMVLENEYSAAILQCCGGRASTSAESSEPKPM